MDTNKQQMMSDEDIKEYHDIEKNMRKKELIKHNKKFVYPGTVRESINGKRHYVIGESKLPSVTTILQATMSEEKRESLRRWMERVGKKEAELVKDRAASRGTTMHKILEHKILGTGHADLTDTGQQAMKMADMIADRGLSKVSEFYGTEVTLHYPDLYAGQTDLSGIFDGKDSIIDFKQTNKPKQREWIDDYFIQLAAYCMAHDFVYGTYIEKGVVMMCSPDLFYQEFIIEGEELKDYKYKWLQRVDQYYAQNS